MRKIFIVLTGVLLIGTMIFLISCEKDDELVTCGGTTCDSDAPYSNSHTSSCYTSASKCEDATGHDCKSCD